MWNVKILKFLLNLYMFFPFYWDVAVNYNIWEGWEEKKRSIFMVDKRQRRVLKAKLTYNIYIWFYIKTTESDKLSSNESPEHACWYGHLDGQDFSCQNSIKEVDPHPSNKSIYYLKFRNWFTFFPQKLHLKHVTVLMRNQDCFTQQHYYPTIYSNNAMPLLFP